MNKKIFYFIAIVATVATVFISFNKDDDRKDYLTVSGKINYMIQAWKKVNASYDGGDHFAATAGIDKNGSTATFSIKLPQPAGAYMTKIADLLTYYMPAEQITVSDNDVNGCNVMFYASNGDNKGLLALQSYNPQFSYSSIIQYMYVNKDVNASGQGQYDISDDETGQTIQSKIELDMNLKKGWNTVVTTVSIIASSSIRITVKVDAVPYSAYWIC
jgi:hypothetical protein